MSRLNQEHWDSFYAANQHIPTTPTTFAHLVLPWLERAKEPLAAQVIVELGCGNGRDALWFAARGVGSVVALDLSHSSIARLQRAVDVDHTPPSLSESAQARARLADHVRFLEADFTTLPSSTRAPPLSLATDCAATLVYSRFTLHAIDAPAQTRALAWAYAALASGGLLAVEARSVKGSLYGKGAAVPGERDAFVFGHYRRFLRRDELLAELQGLGFTVEYDDESDGVAKFGDDDPVVLRVLARK